MFKSLQVRYTVSLVLERVSHKIMIDFFDPYAVKSIGRVISESIDRSYYCIDFAQLGQNIIVLNSEREHYLFIIYHQFLILR